MPQMEQKRPHLAQHCCLFGSRLLTLGANSLRTVRAKSISSRECRTITWTNVRGVASAFERRRRFPLACGFFLVCKSIQTMRRRRADSSEDRIPICRLAFKKNATRSQTTGYEHIVLPALLQSLLSQNDVAARNPAGEQPVSKGEQSRHARTVRQLVG